MLADGTPLNVEFSRASTATITLVALPPVLPALSAQSLALLAALILATGVTVARWENMPMLRGGTPNR